MSHLECALLPGMCLLVQQLSFQDKGDPESAPQFIQRASSSATWSNWLANTGFLVVSNWLANTGLLVVSNWAGRFVDLIHTQYKTNIYSVAALGRLADGLSHTNTPMGLVQGGNYMSVAIRKCGLIGTSCSSAPMVESFAQHFVSTPPVHETRAFMTWCLSQLSSGSVFIKHTVRGWLDNGCSSRGFGWQWVETSIWCSQKNELNDASEPSKDALASVEPLVFEGSPLKNERKSKSSRKRLRWKVIGEAVSAMADWGMSWQQIEMNIEGLIANDISDHCHLCSEDPSSLLRKARRNKV
ncbi:hypothetical protein TIFTF001_036391 [Ficus carica]|uniref:Uncharacterized protein n=1 Tax=Ficus carica TaxID=3494 RepID=A0AA88E465_FICCA|nr:hypothetical protein TIFTF001_036391 [Ficus carica]